MFQKKGLSRVDLPFITSLGVIIACGKYMMTSLKRNAFRVTGPLWGESTGDRWLPLTKASDGDIGCFRWFTTEQAFEQTIPTPVIWDAIALIMTSL